ncbi:MAG TPA: NAD(P)-dependent alcohol dehydrogenase [Candidatus Limnocylindria bacterium]|nr:NAD(P)-dependent alcohol dehydrogenase [Candidatus Limnocylindria bacterium]
MRAVLFRKTGSVDGLVLTDIPKPAPGPKEVLVRIHATSVTRGDVVLRKIPFLLARLFGQKRKAMLGHEFAGQVEAIGTDVTRFAVGDRVLGTSTGLPTGTYAEYICVPEDGMLATIPPTVSYEEAAPVPIGATTALQFLRGAGLASGRRVLIVGASGSVGSYAIQLAAHAGAHVTGVSSGRNAELVRSLGAEEVVDYTRQDITRGETRYDLIFDAVGSQSAGGFKRILAEGGSFASVRSSTTESPSDLATVRDLLAAGELRAIIDRRYTLEQIPEAHTYVEQGRKTGNVLITVQG